MNLQGLKFHSGYDYMQIPEEDKELRHYDEHTDTMPDQSMSIRDILIRSQYGMADTIYQEGYYDEDEPAEPVGGYDLTDIDASTEFLNSIKDVKQEDDKQAQESIQKASEDKGGNTDSPE